MIHESIFMLRRCLCQNLLCLCNPSIVGAEDTAASIIATFLHGTFMNSHSLVTSVQVVMLRKPAEMSIAACTLCDFTYHHLLLSPCRNLVRCAVGLHTKGGSGRPYQAQTHLTDYILQQQLTVLQTAQRVAATPNITITLSSHRQV